MIQISQLIRDGRDAVIAEKFRDAGPATNPYSRTSKSHVFWQRGADETRARADAVLQVGA